MHLLHGGVTFMKQRANTKSALFSLAIFIMAARKYPSVLNGRSFRPRPEEWQL